MRTSDEIYEGDRIHSQDKQPRLSWRADYYPVGTVGPAQRRTRYCEKCHKRKGFCKCHESERSRRDYDGFDAIFRRLVECYNELTEIERKDDILMFSLLNQKRKAA